MAELNNTSDIFIRGDNRNWDVYGSGYGELFVLPRGLRFAVYCDRDYGSLRPCAVNELFAK